MAPPTLDAFQVIADPNRRYILGMLSKETRNINALAEHFDMSRPAVSKHIKVLHSAGFISINQVGRERHCALKKDGFLVLKTWLNYFDEFWNTKLQDLESAMDRESEFDK